VVSVTSEISANVSFQGAPARSGRSDPDQSAGNDSFAALVDSNTAAGNNDNRSQDAAPRRPDDSQSPADNRARDNAAASDKAASDKAARSDARNDSSDRDAAVDPRDTAVADGKAVANGRTKSKSASSKSDAKSDETKSDDAKESKPASGDNAAAASQTDAKADGTANVTANAIATVIPVAAATAETAVATPASDKATAPLAIAAAAIAATASLTGEIAGPAGADASTTPAVTADAAKTETTKTDTHAAASVAVTAQAADTTITSGIALAASAAATTPGASKPVTQAKTPVVAKEGAAISGEPDATASTAAPSAPAPGTIVPAVAPQAEVAGQPKAESGIVDTAKAEIAGKSASSADAHSATADAGQTLINASNNSLPAPGAVQTQQQPVASPTPAPQLNVTAATTVAVPLSGLAMEIAASAKSGKSRFEIRLDPAELGRIDVRIDIDRHGQVTSHLTVERPETLSMLRQDANQLQRALDNAGLSTGNSGLQFSLRDQSSQGQNGGNQSNPNAHRLIVSEDDTVAATVAGRSYGRTLGSSSGVDIRI
jgi:flagellar hook-length control protein FliK